MGHWLLAVFGAPDLSFFLTAALAALQPAWLSIGHAHLDCVPQAFRI